MGGSLEVIKKIWIYVFLVIFIINILILDIYFLSYLKILPSQFTLPGNITPQIDSQNFCPQNCVDQINLASASSSIIHPTLILTPTPSAIPTPKPTAIPVKTVREFFVPLGTGTGNSADWTVIDGIGAKIDPADYGNIKQITFELTAQIPTGNQTIWIRLYNANTYQSVAGSEMTMSGGTATLLTSSPINFASGNNLYQVQMKTQLQYPVNIDMARIRIKTN